MPKMAAPAMQGTCRPKKGILPPKAYWPPMPMTMMEAMTAMFLEENMSTFFSIMMAIPWAAMAPKR